MKHLLIHARRDAWKMVVEYLCSPACKGSVVALGAIAYAELNIDTPLILHEHRRSRRVYAATRKGKPFVVHVHSDILRIPDVNLFGILLHEAGHIGDWADGGSSTEKRADGWVNRKLGVRITYTGPERLETIGTGTLKEIMGET